MGWTTPGFSRRKVNAAGEVLRKPISSSPEVQHALNVVNNWRSCHGFPLNTMQVNLRSKVAKIDSDGLVAQRTKRLVSIRHKLERYDQLDLGQIQDIAGCRAVLKDMEAVDSVYELYGQSKSTHVLLREDDYIRTNPKPSGYRGVHLVYKYSGRETHAWDNLRIEIQLRTKLQHAWATAVETVGTFTSQALKSSWGESDWLRFFVLMSAVMADQEGTTRPPGVPNSQEERQSELRSLVISLNVIERLDAYGSTLKHFEDSAQKIGKKSYSVLDLDVPAAILRVYTHRSANEAALQYEQIEAQVAESEGRDVVLVSVDSLNGLRRAFPNYFLDTNAFLDQVRDAIA